MQALNKCLGTEGTMLLRAQVPPTTHDLCSFPSSTQYSGWAHGDLEPCLFSSIFWHVVFGGAVTSAGVQTHPGK